MPEEHIDILEIPSSIGTASIGNYRTLSEYFSISSYTMADQYFQIILDHNRNCIFDDAGNLLQIKFSNYFFSIYRPHNSGNAYGILAKLLLFPFDILSNRLKRKYRLVDSTSTTKLLLLHPEAEYMVNQGLMHWEKIDIFRPIHGHYDLILSFNLLQKNYFTDVDIKAGKDNLAKALKDGGVLIMGSTESYKIYKKISDQLVELESVGDF